MLCSYDPYPYSRAGPAARRIVDGRLHELEVLGTVVGDEEEAVTVVLHVVLDALALEPAVVGPTQRLLHQPARDQLDATHALQNARDVYARRGGVVSIWVVPSAAITASPSDEAGPFFDPGADKIYRHPQFYKVPRGLKGF